MILRIDNINSKEFIFPKQNDVVFLVAEKQTLVTERTAITVYNSFNQQIGYISNLTNTNDKVRALLLANKPLLNKVVLSNQNHQYILIESVCPLHVPGHQFS